MLNASTSHAAIDPADLTIVVPTLNPGPCAGLLVDALRDQGVSMARVVIIDSQSDDGSIEVFRRAGCAIHVIERALFDHGGTRNFGLEMSPPSEIVLFLTQDALPTGHDMVVNLLAPFQDPQVALVYGRQLARDGAGTIEAHARKFNYPLVSASRALPAARSLGIKAVFNSNSFAAYRRNALASVGGFPAQIIMGEDQAAAAELLNAGWTVAYQAEACVQHSHGYTVTQEFARYFDIGVFHEQQRVLLAPFGTAGSEGFRYVASEMRYLLHSTPWRIPEAFMRTAAKLLGYRLGLRHRHLPDAVNRMLAMNKGFFRPREVARPQLRQPTLTGHRL